MARQPPLSRAARRRMTAPGLLCERARTTPEGVAFRSKHLGIYRERSWLDYATLVARCAKAFAGLGLKPGDRVAIMGDACEEWAVCDQAAQALGAIVYGIYPTASTPEIEYQMKDGGAVIFVAENQEHVDRILPLLDRLPGLAWIVVIDDAAMFAYDHPKLRPYQALIDEQTGNLAWLDHQARLLDPNAPAFIVYTSGTTGHPKGALISHGRHLAATLSLVECYPTLANRPHRTVVYLPLCHVLGRDVAVTLPLISAVVPHYGEDVEDFTTTLFEIAPTVLFTVPRYMQKFAAQILVGLGNSSPLKRAVYGAALRLARRYVCGRWENKVSFPIMALQGLAHATVFRPILNKIGFDALELVICGGAPLPAETMALWHMYGVNLVEIYGQTEAAGGIITGQRGPFPRPGDVGTAPPGWDVRLAEDGEVLVRGADLFEGYWANDEATRGVMHEDGWMRTGDIGEWRDGALRLVDRARDFIVTSGGKTLSPSFIENQLRASPYVAEAMVVGHGRKYLAALIEIDFDTVSDWARSRNVSYTGFTSLADNAQVTALIRAEIDRINAQLARVEQIKAFRIIPKALDPEEEGEPVTPTRKVKRAQMQARFSSLVDAMYDDEEERLVSDEIGGVLKAS